MVWKQTPTHPPGKIAKCNAESEIWVRWGWSFERSAQPHIVAHPFPTATSGSKFSNFLSRICVVQVKLQVLLFYLGMISALWRETVKTSQRVHFPKGKSQYFRQPQDWVILASRTFYTDYWASFKLQTMYLVYIKQQHQIHADQLWIQTLNNLGHFIWASLSHSYHIGKVGVIKRV